MKIQARWKSNGDSILRSVALQSFSLLDFECKCTTEGNDIEYIGCLQMATFVYINSPLQKNTKELAIRDSKDLV